MEHDVVQNKLQRENLKTQDLNKQYSELSEIEKN